MITTTLSHNDYDNTSFPCKGDWRNIALQLWPHVLPVQWWLPHHHTMTATTSLAPVMMTDNIFHYYYNHTSCRCNCDCRTITLWLRPHILPVQCWLTKYHTTTQTTRPVRVMVNATLWLQKQKHVLPVQRWLSHNHTMTTTTRPARAMVNASISHYDYNNTSCPRNDDCNTIRLWLWPHVPWNGGGHTTTMTICPAHVIAATTLSHYN